MLGEQHLRMDRFETENALRKSKNGVKWRQNVASVVPHRSMRSDISRASSFFFQEELTLS